MANARQKVVARSPLVAGSPANEVRTLAEEHEDAFGAASRGTQATLGTKAAR